MEPWIGFAMIAAVFITIRDYVSLDLIRRYSYINYVVYTNIFIFIGTMIYVYINDVPLIQPNSKDMMVILLRVFIACLIIDPSIFYAMKYCKNPSYAKSIISLNTLFLFIAALIFLKGKLSMKGGAGVLSMLFGSYLLS